MTDFENLFEEFEHVANRHVPMTRRRRFWIQMRRTAFFFGWKRLYWYCSWKIWQ